MKRPAVNIVLGASCQETKGEGIMYRISAATIDWVRNEDMRNYARRYVEIGYDLVAQICAQQVEVAPRDERLPIEKLAENDSISGIKCRNNGCSFSYGWLSPSCEACAKGESCVTFYLSLMCNRNCFFCFNPNQQGYDQYRSDRHDLIAVLDAARKSGAVYRDIALTGGEPLMFPESTLDFFCHARSLFPQSRLRLYTNGDFATDELLEKLAEAGLDEIRFSVKQDDESLGYVDEAVIEIARRAKEHISSVVIEMPVLPGDNRNMQELMSALDDAGVDGVNLLELCYPFHRWDEYARRGYAIKNPPYRIPDQYSYAGGLPVSGSEDTALDVIKWAARKKLRMGVHYCSLENKFTSDIFLKNQVFCDAFDFMVLSPRDFYLKTAKVFGGDAARVRVLLKKSAGQNASEDSAWHVANWDDMNELPDSVYMDEKADALWFHPSLISQIALKYPDMEIALCYHVAENGESLMRLREVAIDVISASSFSELDHV